MTDGKCIEEFWRIGGLTRRRRTYPTGYVEEILKWRGYALTWTGGDRLRFIGEVRSGRYAKWIILVCVAVVVVAVVAVLLAK